MNDVINKAANNATGNATGNAINRMHAASGWRRLHRPLALAVLSGALLASLQGCIELAVGSAVVGTFAATDRRTFGAQTEDKSIVLKAEGRVGTLLSNAGHVNISSFNRRVLLTGEVKDQATKTAVEREVTAIEGVQLVINELETAGAASYTSRSNDTLITGKVKAGLIDAKDIMANSFKVVTERSIVYLMGRVTQREGDVAAEVARSVGGVQRVIKVFEYISESDLQQINKSSNNGTSAPTTTP
jgi:osmotically-inducible protein OsmY